MTITHTNPTHRLERAAREAKVLALLREARANLRKNAPHHVVAQLLARSERALYHRVGR